jgi:hypothetical protein
VELHAVAAVLGGGGKAEAFLELDGDHGALVGPVDARVAAGRYTSKEQFLNHKSARKHYAH